MDVRICTSLRVQPIQFRCLHFLRCFCVRRLLILLSRSTKQLHSPINTREILITVLLDFTVFLKFVPFSLFSSSSISLSSLSLDSCSAIIHDLSDCVVVSFLLKTFLGKVIDCSCNLLLSWTPEII